MATTLITVNEYLDSGVNTSDDIRPREVEFVIKTVETIYLKPFISDELYTALLDQSYANADLKNSIKFAEYHLVFAYMLYDRFRLTRYSSVIKDDEHSTDPSEDDIMSICSMHWENGIEIIIDALLANDLEPADEVTPQPPFAELLFKYYNKHKR